MELSASVIGVGALNKHSINRKCPRTIRTLLFAAILANKDVYIYKEVSVRRSMCDSNHSIIVVVLVDAVSDWFSFGVGDGRPN